VAAGSRVPIVIEWPEAIELGCEGLADGSGSEDRDLHDLTMRLAADRTTASRRTVR
jgi:hypothetical protein